MRETCLAFMYEYGLEMEEQTRNMSIRQHSHQKLSLFHSQTAGPYPIIIVPKLHVETIPQQTNDFGRSRRQPVQLPL